MKKELKKLTIKINKIHSDKELIEKREEFKKDNSHYKLI